MKHPWLTEEAQAQKEAAKQAAAAKREEAKQATAATKQAAKIDAEEIREGAIHARQRAQAAGEGEKRQKEIAKTEESTAREIGGKAVSLIASPLKMLLGGTSKTSGSILPKGIRYPDQTIKNKELYLGSGQMVTPTGQVYSGDWHEIYFGKSRIKQDAAKVVNAIGSGANDLNSISITTGLEPNRINAALRFLESQGYETQFYQEE